MMDRQRRRSGRKRTRDSLVNTKVTEERKGGGSPSQRRDSPAAHGGDHGGTDLLPEGTHPGTGKGVRRSSR